MGRNRSYLTGNLKDPEVILIQLTFNKIFRFTAGEPPLKAGIFLSWIQNKILKPGITKLRGHNLNNKTNIF